MFVCVCACVHTHAHTHTLPHTHACAQTHTSTHTPQLADTYSDILHIHTHAKKWVKTMNKLRMMWQVGVNKMGATHLLGVHLFRVS